jgi:hypothetical protein
MSTLSAPGATRTQPVPSAVHPASMISTEKSSMVSRPNTRFGHGGAAPGSLAVKWAMEAMAPAKSPAMPISTAANHGITGKMVTSAVPSMGTGATRGHEDIRQQRGGKLALQQHDDGAAQPGPTMEPRPQPPPSTGTSPMPHPNAKIPSVAGTESRNPYLTPKPRLHEQQGDLGEAEEAQSPSRPAAGHGGDGHGTHQRGREHANVRSHPQDE